MDVDLAFLDVDTVRGFPALAATGDPLRLAADARVFGEFCRAYVTERRLWFFRPIVINGKLEGTQSRNLPLDAVTRVGSQGPNVGIELVDGSRFELVTRTEDSAACMATEIDSAVAELVAAGAPGHGADAVRAAFRRWGEGNPGERIGAACDVLDLVGPDSPAGF